MDKFIERVREARDWLAGRRGGIGPGPARHPRPFEAFRRPLTVAAELSKGDLVALNRRIEQQHVSKDSQKHRRS